MGGMKAEVLGRSLDALEERNALRKLEPWIGALARRYFGNSPQADDAKQIARTAAMKAIRTWDETQATRSSYVKHSARYAVIDFFRKEKSAKHWLSNSESRAVPQGEFLDEGLRQRGTDCESFADKCALDAERALIVLELYNALSKAQQAEVDRLLEHGRGRGQSRTQRELARAVLEILEAA